MIAILLVAATYIHFLLFAQFGLIRGIHDCNQNPDTIRVILGTMAAAGILGSLFAPVLIRRWRASGVMMAGSGIASLSALIAGILFGRSLAPSTALLAFASALTGLGLAWLTVALASDLRRLTAGRRIATHVGAGTAVAYFFCNIHAVFHASPAAQSWIAAVAAAVAVVFIYWSRHGGDITGCSRRLPRDLPQNWFTWRGVSLVTLGFLALVWFDSAAFATVQLSAEMRARFWGDAPTLWLNGSFHAAAAILAGLSIDRGWFRGALCLALTALVIGAIGFHAAGSFGAIGAWTYVAGVSVYSTALATYAAIGPEDARAVPSAWRAACVYAVAGWLGSTAGVGLAEQRGALPNWAAPVAIAIFLVAMLALDRRMRIREAACA